MLASKLFMLSSVAGKLPCLHVPICQVAFVLELCRGCLSKYLQYFGSIHEEERVAWSHQMCAGLGHIHECSVIHRDVKPENLLLQRSPGGPDFLKIGDFGNSCIVVEDSGKRPLPQNLRELRQGVTTYTYAAPEILKKEPYDFRSDVWSAGVVIYEMLQTHPARTAIKYDKIDTMELMLPKTMAFIQEVTRLDPREIPDLKLVKEMVREAPKERPYMKDILSRRDFSPITKWGVAKVIEPSHEQRGELAVDTDLGSTFSPDKILRGGTPDGVDLGALPDMLKLAREAHSLFIEMIPVDIPVGVEVVETLGPHTSNLILQYMILMSKYPTAMRLLGKHFKLLPEKLTRDTLKDSCHGAILEVARHNGEEVFQQEMRILDEQRMGTCMGFPRVMEKFKLLRKVTDALPVSGECVSLGHGKPVLKYELVYDPEALQKCIDAVDALALQLKFPKVLSNASAIQYISQLSALQHCLPTETRTGQPEKKAKPKKKAKLKPLKVKHLKRKVHCELPASGLKRCKLPASGLKGGKLLKPYRRCYQKGSHRDKTIQPDTVKGYLLQHFKRKHIWWLVLKFKRIRALDIDFDRMSVADYLYLVPDQSGYLTNLGRYGIHTCGALARVIRTPPLLSSCVLCQLGPVIKHGFSWVYQDARYRPSLSAMNQEHKEKYSMPPSAFWLARNFAKKIGNPPLSHPLGIRDAASASASSVGHQAPPPQTAPKDSGVAPPAKAAPQDSGVGDASTGLRGAKWYFSESAPARLRCECPGNCPGNCPARQKGHSCPNAKVSGRRWCVACGCKHPGCPNQARRPLYKETSVPENYGFCLSHQPKKRAKKPMKRARKR